MSKMIHSHVKVTEFNNFQVRRDEIPTKVRVLMLKGEKGDKGDKGDPGSGEYISNYDKLTNKPQINSVELIGNKSLDDLGVLALTNMEIQEIFSKNN